MFPYTSNWVLLAPLAVAIYIAMRLAQGRSDTGNRTAAVAAMEGVVASALVLALAAVGVRASGVMIGWIVVVGVCLVILSAKLRQLRRLVLMESLLGIDDDAARGRILRDFAEEAGWLGRVARRIANDLRKGTSLIDAMERNRVAVGLYGRLRLRLIGLYGKQAPDQSPEVGQRVGEDSEWTLASVGAEVERITGRLSILVPVVGFVWVMHAVFTLFVMNVFLPILNQMGLESRKYFGWVEWYPLKDMTTPSQVAAAGIALSLIGVVLLGAAIWVFPGLLKLLGGRYLLSGYHRLACLLVLSETLRYERDLVAALNRVPEITRLRYLGVYFRRAAELIDGGHDVADALTRARVLKPGEAQSLQQSQSPASMAWAIGRIAQRRAERLVQRLNVLVQIVIVAATGACAVVAGLLAVAIFRALADWIHVLA
ncbi:MAG: hypothetical protein D6753_14675 [Planctomycetota bacterium]|nr:MAG: hypothetical protein D6753_14675 [Planctomycetota bacterium]